MKKQILLAVIGLIMIPALGFSQIDIVPTYGYNFGANNSGYYSDIKMKGNSTFGLNVEIKLDDFTGVQLSYTYTNSYITIKDYNALINPGITKDFSNVTENYYLIGAIRYFSQEKIQLYGTFSAGAVYYNFTEIDPSYSKIDIDALRFAVGFGLGAKIMLSDRIGLDVHVRALAPITWGGISVGVGSGGVSTGAYAGSSFISGDVGGGIIFRLGGE